MSRPGRDMANCGRSDRLNYNYFNARSLVGKADKHKAWIGTWVCDVKDIMEIWLRDGQDWPGKFLEQYVNTPTRDGDQPDLLLRTAVGQVVDMSVGEHLNCNHHNSIKMFMEDDRTNPQVEVLNWGKINFNGIWQEHSKVDREKLFPCKRASGKWGNFKIEIRNVQACMFLPE